MRAYKNVKFAPGGSNGEDIRSHDEKVECEWVEAQVMSSELKPTPWDEHRGQHVIALDIDHEAYLVPSTHQGHSHLYVAVACQWDDYVEFLKAAAKIGLIEHGYYEASKKRGGTFLRVPWLKKGGEEFASIKDVEKFLAEPEPEPRVVMDIDDDLVDLF